MVVYVTENSSDRLRGELTRWVIEIKPGVYVGKLSALVRDKLWEKICGDDSLSGGLMIYTSNNEQGFDIEMYGEPHRHVVDLEGIKLIGIS